MVLYLVFLWLLRCLPPSSGSAGLDSPKMVSLIGVGVGAGCGRGCPPLGAGWGFFDMVISGSKRVREEVPRLRPWWEAL